MNRYRLAIAALLVVAAAFVVLTFMPEKRLAPAASAEAKFAPQPKAASAGVPRAQPAQVAGRSAAAPEARGGAGLRAPEARSASPASEPAAPADDASGEAAATPRERAVAAWEALVDRMAEQKDAPPDEQTARVKEAFDALDKADRMDGIRRSLNLFPDEQFPALYGILFDKSQDPEVLDAIFSDALNRPEELKNPLMKELVKDKEHPCFFESARILDVIGELNAPPAPTPSP